MKEVIKKEVKGLVTLRTSNRPWMIPLLAAICIGAPLLAGLYLGDLQSGLFACLSAMVILYLPAKAPVAVKMVTLLTCAFGFLFSFAVGLLFSFNPWVAAIVLGIFATFVHWVNLYFATPPPGSFFFVMIAAMTLTFPYEAKLIPHKLGLMALGTIFTCTLGFIYSLVAARKLPARQDHHITTPLRKNSQVNLIEAAIHGLFLFGALAIGYLAEMENPYWVPISCAAVMQGASRYHIWQRSFHRILGTFVGVGLCWMLLQIITTPLEMVLAIILLQFIIEMLITRQYALAVIFITPLTVFLAEIGVPMASDSSPLISIRLWDIVLGSVIGAIGGWVLHHEKLRKHTLRQLEPTGSLNTKNQSS